MVKKLGIGCGSLIVIIVVIAIIATVSSGGGGSKSPATEVAEASTSTSAASTATQTATKTVTAAQAQTKAQNTQSMQATTSKPTPTQAPKPTPTPKPAPGSDQPLAMGQTAQVGDAKIVLNKARISSDQSQTPGNEILLLEFRVTYTGKNSYDLSSLLQFALFGKDDRKYTPTIALDENGSLDGTLQPGQSQLGEVAFDVPKTNAPFRADFEQVFGTKSTQWTVPQP